MARNMIETSQLIFSALINNVSELSAMEIDGNIQRCIKTENTDCKEIIKCATDIVATDFGVAGQYLFLSHLGKEILVVKSSILPLESITLPAISEVAINAGYVTLFMLYFRKSLRFNCSPLDAYNIITAGDEHGVQRVYYDLEDLFAVFGNFRVFEISKDFCDGDYFAYRVIGQLLIFANKFSLAFSHDTLCCFEKYFYEQNSSFPHDKLVDSLLATRWNHAFLEAYRCIEFVFPISRVENLKSALGLSCSLYALFNHCHEKLGWKPHEESALAELIEVTPGWLDFCDGVISTQVSALTAKCVAKFIYKKRNLCVHFRSQSADDDVNPDLYNKMIQLLVHIALHQHMRYIDSSVATLAGSMDSSLPICT